MSKKFQLHIPEPCHESWDQMSPVEQGRFCNSCQKAVVDFTGMSDTQLVAFFKKPSTGPVCGRFNDGQLQRDLAIPGKRMPWFRYLLQFIIPVFLTSFKSYSQGNLVLKERTTPVCTNPKYDQRIVVGNSLRSFDKEMLGKVTDEKGIGISYASVMIKETKYGVSCDSAGNFYLKIPNGIKKITLMASSIGYSQEEKEINTKKDNPTEIKLKTNTFLNGEVVVTAMGSIRLGGITGYTVIKKKSYLQKVKELFTSDSVNVYPNPAAAGTELKIELKKKEAGKYSLDLYNIQGQLIKSSVVEVDDNTNVFHFQLPAVTPGSYLLNFTNKRSGKKHSEKVIIQ